jgi:hypothetical protein
MVFFLLALSVAASTAAASPTLSVDLDGDGRPETVTATPARRGARVEVRSGDGRKLASADAPGPRSGAASVALTSGSLGSAGALVEVVVSTPAEECRSVWRLAAGELSRVPFAAAAGATAPPDCAPAGEWTWSWDQPTEKKDEPARYRRERSRETPEGTLHQIDSFRWVGFKLERDPERSMAEVRGITIPTWYSATLYPKSVLENLYTRYDLAPLKAAPRLLWRTDPGAGVFSLDVERAGRRESMPVVRTSKGAERNELLLTVRGSQGERQVRVTLAGGSPSPGETVLAGFDERLDGYYTPAMRLVEGGLRIFASASDELGSNGLAGTWTGAKGEMMAVTIASGEPLLLQIGKSRYRVEIDAAPEGLDVLAVSSDGASAFGVKLRGPNALERVPVRCTAAASAKGCKASGAPERFHRVGARLNAR